MILFHIAIISISYLAVSFCFNVSFDFGFCLWFGSVRASLWCLCAHFHIYRGPSYSQRSATKPEDESRSERTIWYQMVKHAHTHTIIWGICWMSLEHKTYNFNLINGSKVIRINYIGNNGALDIECVGISFAILVCNKCTFRNQRIRKARTHTLT